MLRFAGSHDPAVALIASHFHDIAPDYPRLAKFLDFWAAEIDGIIHSVEVAHKHLVSQAELRHARFHGQLH